MHCDCQDAEGTTPLMQAAKNGKVNVVDALLEEGAEVNKRKKSGE